jgi:molecular chaperone DnaK (HSP70)
MSEKIYGIDLGTTNSLIGCEGKLITGLVSSKINISNRTNVSSDKVGEDIFGSYKVDMGLGEEGIFSIDASSITLKTLANMVKDKTNEIVKDVVISVPAYFSSNQRTAVRISAEKAGLNLISVINEPTAAALKICGVQDDGKIRRDVFIVYDLGGGTFDCTVIDSRSGKYHVVGTDGCILGGDNLDRNIAEYIMNKLKIPIYKRTTILISELIEECKKWKIQMQQNYNIFKDDKHYETIVIPKDFNSDICINITLGDYKKFVRDTFGKTVSIITNLINSKIPNGTDYKVVFVGGSTHCNYLCSYVLEESNIPYNKAEFDRTPDYTVALGVVMYADLIKKGNGDIEFKDVTKQLSIADSNGNAIVIIPANTNIPCSKTKILTNPVDANILNVRLYQGNSLISKNNEYIGSLEYKYERFMKAKEGDVEVTINVDMGGFITLEVIDFINFGEKKSITLRGF